MFIPSLCLIPIIGHVCFRASQLIAYDHTNRHSRLSCSLNIATTPLINAVMSATHLSQLVRSADVPAIDTLLSVPGHQAQVSLLLLQHDADGHTALHWAAMSDHPALLQRLLPYIPSGCADPCSTATPQLDQTPLHWACVAGHPHSVCALLRAGADPTLKDSKGYNAAIHAAQYGHIDVLHILLNAVPHLNDSADLTGNNLLAWAAYYDHAPTVRYLLLVQNLSPDTRDNAHTTPLHRAARADKNVIAEILLRAAGTPFPRDSRDRTPLDLAIPHSATASLLRDWVSGLLTVNHPYPTRHSLSRYSLIIFYYALLIASYYFYNTLLMSRSVLPPLTHVASHVCIFISVISHLRATFRNPGDVQRGTPRQFVQYIEQALQRGDSSLQLLPSAYCYTCLAPRPPRSKHSRHRDVCVRRFDHECPWVNNSIGLYTHKPLLYLVASTATVQIIFIYATLRMFLVDSYQHHVPIIMSITTRPLLMFLVVSNAAVAVFCVALLVTHLRLIARGVTTYELLSAERQNLPIKNDHDKGSCKNFLAFLSSTGPGTGTPYTPLSLSSFISAVMPSSPLSARHGTNASSCGLDDDDKHLLKPELDSSSQWSEAV